MAGVAQGDPAAKARLSEFLIRRARSQSAASLTAGRRWILPPPSRAALIACSTARPAGRTMKRPRRSSTRRRVSPSAISQPLAAMSGTRGCRMAAGHVKTADGHRHDDLDAAFDAVFAG